MSSIRTDDDAIYTCFGLQSLPHRIRIRQVISALRRLCFPGFTMADVGCGGGYVTEKLVSALRPGKAAGFDFNRDLISRASEMFPNISFHVWDVTRQRPPVEKYDIVTCLETLEHVLDYEVAISRILAITSKFLLITVPIEIGAVGIAKFAGKAAFGRDVITEEHVGSRYSYFRQLVSKGDISAFRKNCHAGHWLSHTGFDYRKIDEFLNFQSVKFNAKNRGWNRFYLIAPESRSGCKRAVNL
jgi:SAM-dependent methyltransferase